MDKAGKDGKQQAEGAQPKKMNFRRRKKAIEKAALISYFRILPTANRSLSFSIGQKRMDLNPCLGRNPGFLQPAKILVQDSKGFSRLGRRGVRSDTCPPRVGATTGGPKNRGPKIRGILEREKSIAFGKTRNDWGPGEPPPRSAGAASSLWGGATPCPTQTQKHEN